MARIPAAVAAMDAAVRPDPRPSPATLRAESPLCDIVPANPWAPDARLRLDALVEALQERSYGPRPRNRPPLILDEAARRKVAAWRLGGRASPECVLGPDRAAA